MTLSRESHTHGAEITTEIPATDIAAHTAAQTEASAATATPSSQQTTASQGDFTRRRPFSFKELFSNPHQYTVEAIFLLVLISPSLMSSFYDLIAHDDHPLLFDPTTILRTALSIFYIGLVFVGWLAVSYRSQTSLKHRLIQPPLILLLIFAVWGVFCSIFNHNTNLMLTGEYTRYNGLLSYLSYLFIGIMLSHVALTKRDLEHIAHGWMYGAIIPCLYGLVQAIGFDPVNWGTSYYGRVGATFGNPNMFGTYLIPVFVMTLISLKASRPLTQKCAFVMCFLIGFNIIATSNRSTLVLAFVILTVMAMIYKTEGSLKHRIKSLLTPKTVCIVGGFIVIIAAITTISRLLPSDDQPFIFIRIASLFSSDTWIHGSRNAIWECALQAIASKPFFGWGVDNTVEAITSYFSSSLAYVYNNPMILVDSAHNLFLQEAISSGIPGAILLGIFIINIIVIGFKTMGKLGSNTPELQHIKIILVALVMAYIGMLIQLLVVPESFIICMYFYILGGLILGCRMRSLTDPESLANQNMTDKTGSRAKSNSHVKLFSRDTQKGVHAHSAFTKGSRAGRLIIGCATLAAFTYIPYSLLHADHLYSVAMTTASATERIDTFEKAARVNPGYATYRWQCLYLVGKSKPVLADREIARRLTQFAQESLQTHPHSPFVRIKALEAYLNMIEAGERSESFLNQTLELAQGTHRLFPTFSESTYLYGRAVYLIEKNPTQTQELLQEAINQAGGTHKQAQQLLDRIGKTTGNSGR